MVHAPYASPAYAARSASGPNTRTTTDTAIIASPSNDVRSANLFLIQFVILTPYLVVNIGVAEPFTAIGDTPLGVCSATSCCGSGIANVHLNVSFSQSQREFSS